MHDNPHWVFYLPVVLVHRYVTGYSGKGAAEQVHTRSERGGYQRHQKVLALCGPSFCHPQCGDGVIKKEKVRTQFAEHFSFFFFLKNSLVYINLFNLQFCFESMTIKQLLPAFIPVRFDFAGSSTLGYALGFQKGFLSWI